MTTPDQTAAERRMRDAVFEELLARGLAEIFGLDEPELTQYIAQARADGEEEIARFVERHGGIPIRLACSDEDYTSAVDAAVDHRLAHADLAVLERPHMRELFEERRAERQRRWEQKSRIGRWAQNARERVALAVPQPVKCLFGAHAWIGVAERNIVGDLVSAGYEVCDDAPDSEWRWRGCGKRRPWETGR
jgi:hypothetical protein